MEKLTAWLEGERGRVTRLAEVCGVTHSAVLQWKDIPPKHVIAIETLTGISRYELRPDVFGVAA